MAVEATAAVQLATSVPGWPQLLQFSAMTAPFSIDAALAEARTLMRARQHDKARILYREILARAPAHASAHFMLGVASAELRDFPTAIASVERAFTLVPEQPAPNRLVFANILLDGGEPVRAEAQASAALALAPHWAAALNVLGVALQRQGRPDEALVAYTSATAADAGYVNAHRNRARLLHERAQVLDAIEGYRRVLELDGADADSWALLGNALTDAGQHSQAQQAYRETLRLRPGYHQVESTLLINLHYDPAFDAAAIFAAHRAWATRHAAGLAPAQPPRPRTLGANDRLRVALLSPALRSGPTGTFVTPIFEHLDRKRFELFAYNANGVRDALSARLERLADHWHDAWTEDDAALAAKIRADGIDILVDLAGHTPGGRPLVLARKPAPVIATWLDYFDTTGLESVDYLIGDPVSTPLAATQRFTERVVRIEPSRLCYAPPTYAPGVAPAPVARNGFITFGSFNRLSKIVAPVIELWAATLRALPASRLLLKNAAFADARTREALGAHFQRLGIARERLELRAHSPHQQMLDEYADVDIALDPFPYNGGLTTCEALWMGVPLLAVMGDSMISRQSAALLHAAGLSSWVAADADDFVRRALSFASDPAALAALRAGMRAHLQRGALMDAARFTRGFETALEAMWDEARRAR
jgi:protein O-GlcNAc transferase